MTLPRLLFAMALRSLATAAELRLDPIARTIVGAVGFVTEGRWDVDGLLTVPAAVGELGARVSGVVAGCGCTETAAPFACEVSGPHGECECACHDVLLRLFHARGHLRTAIAASRFAIEELAARPKPKLEADDYFWCPVCERQVPIAPGTSMPEELCDLCAASLEVSPLSYGVTAPGGCS